MIAHIGGQALDDRPGKALLVPDPGHAVALQAGERLAQARQRFRRRSGEDRLDEIALQIGDQAAERADHAGALRHEHARNAEFARQEAAEHRAGAAEGHQREVAQVDAVARDELVDLDEHLGDRDRR